jgi:hypothetical protein
MRIAIDWRSRAKLFALAAVMATPFLSPWLIKAIAAVYYDWIYYGNYYSLISLSYISSAVAIFVLLKKPKRVLGIGLLISILYMLIGIFLPSPRCEEYLTLHDRQPTEQHTNACN